MPSTHITQCYQMGVSKNNGTPKWMVPQNGWFIMENPIRMADLGGTIIFGNTQIDTKIKISSPKIMSNSIRNHAEPGIYFGVPRRLIFSPWGKSGKSPSSEK